jgi:protein-tyrosine-phosphatase
MSLISSLLLACVAATSAAAVGGRRARVLRLAGALSSAAAARENGTLLAAEPPPLVLDCSNAATSPDKTWHVQKYSSGFSRKLTGSPRVLKMATCLYTGEHNSDAAFPIKGAKGVGVGHTVAGPRLPPLQVMMLVNFAPAAKGGGEVFKGGFVVGNGKHSIGSDGVTLRLKGFRLVSKAVADNPLGRQMVSVKRKSSVLKIMFTSPTEQRQPPHAQAEAVLEYAQIYGRPPITYICGESEAGGQRKGCALCMCAAASRPPPFLASLPLLRPCCLSFPAGNTGRSPVAEAVAAGALKALGASNRMSVRSRAANLDPRATTIEHEVVDAAKRLHWSNAAVRRLMQHRARPFFAPEMVDSYIILTVDGAIKDKVRNLLAAHYKIVADLYESIGKHFHPPADNVFTIPEWIGIDAIIPDNAWEIAQNHRLGRSSKRNVDDAFDIMLQSMARFVPDGVAKATFAMLPPV